MRLVRSPQPPAPKVAAQLRRVAELWSDCLTRYGGPYLFGAAPCAADAFYGAFERALSAPPPVRSARRTRCGRRPAAHSPRAAPVATRLCTYDVPLPGDLPLAAEYVTTILRHPAVRKWYADAAGTEAIAHYDAGAAAYGAPRAAGTGLYDAGLSA